MAQLTPHDEVARLRAIEVLPLGPRFDGPLRSVTQLVARVLDARVARFNVVNATHVWTRASSDGGNGLLPREESFCTWLMGPLDELVIHDARLDPRFEAMAAVSQGQARFYAGRAVRTSDGFKVGTLCVLDPSARQQVRPEQLEGLRTLADQLGLLLELGALREKVKETPTQIAERMISVLVHDLRSPLTSIVTGAELLRRRTPLSPTQEKVVRRISAAAARIHRLAEDLLDYARIRSGGGFPVRPELQDVAALAETVLDELRLTNDGRVLVLRALPNLWAEVDADRVTQALTNLVLNAIQHGAPHGVVEISAAGDADWVRLSVHNRGPPIPQELLPTLFDAFHAGNGGPRERHLGLGLFIVGEIARAHGGRVEVRSNEGDGTTFTLWLPRHPGH